MGAHMVGSESTGVPSPISSSLGADLPVALQLLADAFRLAQMLSHERQHPMVTSETTARTFPASPRWDANTRTLFCGDGVVKRFKLPAANQELILTAFEEEGWPPRIDDPLPGEPGVDPRQRLRDTIRALNGKQDCPALRFSGDGTGTGISWHCVLKDG
jgi:hypothetical protein